MKESIRTLMLPDQVEIKYHQWLSEESVPKAAVQIVHGLAEHSARYCNFAEFLCRQGYHVFAADHLGHGLTAGTPERLGHFSDQQGWEKNRDVSIMLSESVRNEFPGLPLFLLGHSMGSAIARDMLAEKGEIFRAVILSGAFYTPLPVLVAGHFLSGAQKLLLGKKHRSKLISKLMFGPNNKKIENPVTRFDWLTHDEEICRKYAEDPYCGFVCTSGFYKDFFQGISNIQNKSRIRNIPSTLPLLFISGDEDPVGDYGKGVNKAHKLMAGSGLVNTRLIMFGRMRHEILNETEKEKVYSCILDFLSEHLS